jgi:hypothetical protein
MGHPYRHYSIFSSVSQGKGSTFRIFGIVNKKKPLDFTAEAATRDGFGAKTATPSVCGAAVAL